MKWRVGLLLLNFGFLLNSYAVPPVLNYAGQVTVNGEAFDGAGLFKFALVSTDGTTTYWSNDGTSVEGSEPQASVAVPVNGGLYAVLLGNTAQQGMGAIDPALFAQHTDAKLRVWFSDGVNGFQKLSPDRPFASVPFAFNSESAKSADTALNAETAKTAESANVAMAVQVGAITKQMLGSGVLADINATIGMNRLSTEVTEKLNQEKTTNNYNAPSVGSLLAVPSGSDAPAGYSLYQQGEPRELAWEEKAPVSVARSAYDGVEVLDGKIYFVGGWNGSAKNIAERYAPETNTWETIASMSVGRSGVASAVLNGKLYAIGGQGVASVEVYDPSTESWSAGVALPSEVNHGTAFTVGGKIYLIGGRNASDQNINQVLCFDPSTNQWQAKANMPTARNGAKLVWFENRIWAIAGFGTPANSTVESYDPQTDTWRTEKQLPRARHWPVAWVSHERIYVGGLQYGSHIDYYDPAKDSWIAEGNLPENKYMADSVVLNNTVYVFAGSNASGVYSKKVYAADLNASTEGVYDLYRKDGDAPVGTPVVQSEYADGSVTASKMAEGAVSKSALDATILKYLKPEITSQPQAKIVYSYSNVSYSVTTEGKYLTYQWKKDGVDLAGETNATLKITDANATQHDGNYSVVVSNDFGSLESGKILIDVNKTWATDGLIAWYPLDQNASDMSGNGNNGTIQNTPEFVTQDDKSFVTLESTAGNDSGTNDHILLPYSSFSPFTRITISGWLNFINSSHSLDHSAAVISFGDHTAGFLGVLAYNSDALNSYFQNITNRTTLDLKGVQNTWVHFAITGDQEMCAGYLNGENVGTSSGLSSYSGGNAAIGRQWWNNGSSTSTRLNGSLDEIRIYNRALSAEEVQALYNLGQ